VVVAVALAGLWLRKPVGPGGSEVLQANLTRVLDAHSPPGSPVLMINASNSPIYPLLLRLGRRQACRYDHTWPISFLYHGVHGTPGQPFAYRGPAELSADEVRFFAELGQDIQRWHPRLVLLRTRGCNVCPEGFEIADYLEHAGFVDRYLRGCREVHDEGVAAIPFAVWDCQ
jgi:hypothetical protein